MLFVSQVFLFGFKSYYLLIENRGNRCLVIQQLEGGKQLRYLLVNNKCV